MKTKKDLNIGLIDKIKSFTEYKIKLENYHEALKYMEKN